MIGIDKILLNNLKITDVDVETLKMNGFTMIESEETNARIFKNVNGEYVGINYIKVSNQLHKGLFINELKVGRKEIENIRNVDYEHLSVNLPKAISESRTNEKNINNLDKLGRSLALVEKELKELGFGDVVLSNADIQQIEININIPLEQEFEEYKEVFEYLKELLPLQLKGSTNSSYEGEGLYTGFQVGNQSVELKFYDKKENISKNYKKELDTELLRIEYTFSNAGKIENTFGTNNLNEITKDNFITISEGFRKQLEGHLIDRIYKDINKQLRHAEKHIRDYKSIKGISAVNNYLKNHQCNLLDVEIILSALKKIETSKNYSRQSKETIKSTLEIEGNRLFGNISKLNEILEKLGYKEIKLNMTKGIEKEVKKHY